ncbi:hypothetical protein FACS1894201_06870 [Bacteroidia bacterium]|nr:hypothetical protein FACS1894201_06870 [Bacteroidia bacterium]
MKNKNSIITLSFLSLLALGNLLGQSIPEANDCNYITSGYYQKLYKADIALKKGNTEEAYQYLLQLEQLCPLQETIGYYEMSNLVRLLLEYKECEKALDYMDYLITYRGYKIDFFSKMEHYSELSYLPDWNSILASFEKKEATFVSDTVLVALFQKMEERDQQYRLIIQPYYHQDSVATRNKNSEYIRLYDAMRKQTIQTIMN